MPKPNYGRPQDEWRDEPQNAGKGNDAQWLEYHLGEKATEKLYSIIKRYELHSYEDLILRALRIIIRLEEQQDGGHPLVFISLLDDPEEMNTKIRRASGIVTVLETLLEKAGFDE